MTLFTPALLFFVPLWTAGIVLENLAVPQEQRPAAPAPDDEDETSPAHWAAMPFTPPPVHVL